ncbi:MAG: phosphoribosylglycinamide formyltransferase [Erysipelotrichaceae bacterium]|nr:MAG: phosphoribosylglycinamide formyltransferase [Erysipelotrichaceae bacterium]
MNRLVIFASGSGTNFEAIVEAKNKGQLDADIIGLICDHHDAGCLSRAFRLNIPSAIFLRNQYPSKIAMDEAILNQVQLWHADWLILAGYMRILSPILINAYPKHILNIHPSLLPKYKGKDALGQALANKDTTLGVSIHYVDEGMDTGEIIKQVSFQITEGEGRTEAEARLHQLEHQLYPQVIEQLLKEST